MDLTSPKIGATQFSTFMAATNGCELWSGWAGGKITSAFNYSAAFILMSLLSLIGLIFLNKIKKREV